MNKIKVVIPVVVVFLIWLIFNLYYNVLLNPSSDLPPICHFDENIRCEVVRVVRPEGTISFFLRNMNNDSINIQSMKIKNSFGNQIECSDLNSSPISLDYYQTVRIIKTCDSTHKISPGYN